MQLQQVHLAQTLQYLFLACSQLLTVTDVHVAVQRHQYTLAEVVLIADIHPRVRAACAVYQWLLFQTQTSGVDFISNRCGACAASTLYSTCLQKTGGNGTVEHQTVVITFRSQLQYASDAVGRCIREQFQKKITFGGADLQQRIARVFHHRNQRADQGNHSTVVFQSGFGIKTKTLSRRILGMQCRRADQAGNKYKQAQQSRVCACGSVECVTACHKVIAWSVNWDKAL